MLWDKAFNWSGKRDVERFLRAFLSVARKAWFNDACANRDGRRSGCRASEPPGPDELCPFVLGLARVARVRLRLRARMRAAVHIQQPSNIQVRVALRRAQAGMAQQLLNRPEVRAGL